MPISLKISRLKWDVLANRGWGGRDHFTGLASGPRDAVPRVELLRGHPPNPSLFPFPPRNILQEADWVGKYTWTYFLTLGSFCKACCLDTLLSCPWLVIRCSPFLEADASKDFLCTCPFRTQQALVSAQWRTREEGGRSPGRVCAWWWLRCVQFTELPSP